VRNHFRLLNIRSNGQPVQLHLRVLEVAGKAASSERSLASPLEGKGGHSIASQASDVDSIPIARSITHDDSIALQPNELVPNVHRLGGAAINWTMIVIDHLSPSFLNFDRQDR
jgi:hypothetical protein